MLSFPRKMAFFSPLLHSGGVNYKLWTNLEQRVKDKSLWKQRLWERTDTGITYHEFFRILSRKRFHFLCVCKYVYFLPFVYAASTLKQCLSAIWSASVKGNEVLKASGMEIINLLLASKVFRLVIREEISRVSREYLTHEEEYRIRGSKILILGTWRVDWNQCTD